MGFRYGQSWRTGPGRRAWLSGPLWAWALIWLLMLPVIVVWVTVSLAVRLLIAVIRCIARLAVRAH